MIHDVRNSAHIATPRWQRIALLVAGLQCLIWGIFILIFPDRSSIAYGFLQPPRELFLWQGMGLVISLYGTGYCIAASNPAKHWAVVLIGLLAKTLGPMGMAWSVWEGHVPARVLVLIPINDLVWWIPFGLILSQSFAAKEHQPNGN